jgi:prepilin-type N-terminal cleavage/methylation domain-containing protein
MRNKAFTLIEILVAVSIIAVLSLIAIAAGMSAKANARDNQRLSDLKLIQIKLESFRDEKGAYPAKLEQLKSEFISQMPIDPVTKLEYRYAGTTLEGSVAKTCLSYHLGAILETKRGIIPAPSNKLKGINCINNGNTSDDFDAPASDNWYDVESPDAFQNQQQQQ